MKKAGGENRLSILWQEGRGSGLCPVSNPPVGAGAPCVFDSGVVAKKNVLKLLYLRMKKRVARIELA